MSADEPSSPRWQLLTSPDVRDGLLFLVGLLGLVAFLVAYLVWRVKPEPLLLGPLLVMTGVSLGAGPDRRRRQRREREETSP